MTKKTVSSSKTEALSAALSEINSRIGGKETAKSILTHKVYPGASVVVVISDGRKFRVDWDDLGLAKRSSLPDKTDLQ